MMQKWLIPHGVLLIEVLCVEEKRFCRCQAGCLQLFNYNLGTQVDHTAHHLSHPPFPHFPALSPATAILCWSPPWRILELFFPENIAHTPTARGGLRIHRIGTQDPIQAHRDSVEEDTCFCRCDSSWQLWSEPGEYLTSSVQVCCTQMQLSFVCK